MTVPLAVQLYTLRREAQKDFSAVLERVARIGYLGVETAGLHGMAPQELRRRLEELDLALIGYFIPEIPTGPSAESILDELQQLGTDVVVAGLGPENFASPDAVASGADRYSQAAELVHRRGMSLGYHNHWWEFTPDRDGSVPMMSFLERLDPAVFLELDFYWLQTAGFEPLTTLPRLGDRVRRLHVKDGPCTRGVPQTAVGNGVVDVPRILEAVPHADWHVAELDEYAGDMFEAVEASYRYLTANGLSRGAR